MTTLTLEQAGSMTGWDLWTHVSGKTSFGQRESTTFQDQRGRKWSLWLTEGRGRQAAHCYAHLSAKTKRRVVTPDGQDTGDRIDDVIHYRGRAGQLVSTYRSVD